MKKSATQPGVLEAKVKTDWEAIEKLFRAGVLSIREIAKQHGITDKAIRNKAKNEGWLRDLTKKVQEQVRSELVRTQVRTGNAADQLRTERDIVDAAAATVVHVVREHRRDISTGRGIVNLLMSQLVDVVGQRNDFEELIDQECAADKTTERRTKLMKAVSIPAHAGTVRDLSVAMKNLVYLERQAFNIADGAEPPPPELPLAERVDEGFAELKAAFAKRLGHAPTTG